jgi:FdhE protein
MNTEARTIQSGQIEAPAGQIPFLRLAGPDIFRHRAERFRQLSQGHSLCRYLSFLGTLAEAQHEALTRISAGPLPNAGQQALCRAHGMPLLGPQAWPRDAAWRAGLKIILQNVRITPLPAPAKEAADRLMQASDAELEGIADRLLANNLAAVGAQDMPFVAAALQVYWTRMAAALGENAFGRLEQAGQCPVCGSHPVTGIVRIGHALQEFRYLSCSLCATEWHMVRTKCSSCESTDGINYCHLEGSNGAVNAESCDQCNSYLKLLNMEKDRKLEAVADDMATLTLDILMSQTGKARAGPNLLFHPGNY